MRYLGERRGLRLMALKTVALAIHDGDLAWSQTTDFSMFCALADQDESEASRVSFIGETKGNKKA